MVAAMYPRLAPILSTILPEMRMKLQGGVGWSVGGGQKGRAGRPAGVRGAAAASESSDALWMGGGMRGVGGK